MRTPTHELELFAEERGPVSIEIAELLVALTVLFVAALLVT